MVKFKWLVTRGCSVSVERWGGTFDAYRWSVRHHCVLSSEGATTLLSCGVLNRRVYWPWLKLRTLGDFASLLESAWDPSNSLVLARL